MCSLFYLLLSLKKETTLLLMLSVINKLSTLTVPSMINFFFTNINLSNMTKLTLLDSLLQEVTVTEIQIATCLIRPSLHCLIHFSKRCVSCRSPVLSSLRLGRQGTHLEHPTHPSHPHKLSNAKEGLYWITHPCPWLNNSAEIVHSPSVKERKMSKI